ncbi:helix-turn-helix domain-containing protein [Streptomyces sporangiiformans]|uniref:PucR family transcriptional regulator n=1 Tax=Streptomyces sporangiiformans TaxID=2315329 RepID=A0A505DQV8_9ACTN|nr:helix-turn-helix domain-containing protein [Streptomyces sporangiiformans]TPQ23617.1 PucR family transcriptional regulator [Streptomyces sporangiiformans]
MSAAEPFLSRRPWHDLPPALAPLLRNRLPDLTTEMVQAIRHEVRGYRQPIGSAVARDLAEAVGLAATQFTELIEDPDAPQHHYVPRFRRLGRLEYLSGRGMEGLQAAYRIGARVACRRYADVARGAALPGDIAVPLSEAVLTHIHALAGESVTGYEAARAGTTDEVLRSRRTLAARLLERRHDPLAEPLPDLARRAAWPLPEQIRCVLLPASGKVPGLDADILRVSRGGEVHLVVPDDRLLTVFEGTGAAVGPAVPPTEAWVSLHCARLAWRLGRVSAEDHLSELHLLHGSPIGSLLADQVLEPLRALPRGKAERLTETLDALLASTGRTAPEVATALGIHPQTARNRLRQLSALYGDRLDDPAFRFDAQLALRSRSPRLSVLP